jgi:hypothetical protein
MSALLLPLLLLFPVYNYHFLLLLLLLLPCVGIKPRPFFLQLSFGDPALMFNKAISVCEKKCWGTEFDTVIIMHY